MRLMSDRYNTDDEVGRYFVDGPLLYRMTKNGREVIAEAVTNQGAEFLSIAANAFDKFKLK